MEDSQKKKRMNTSTSTKLKKDPPLPPTYYQAHSPKKKREESLPLLSRKTCIDLRPAIKARVSFASIQKRTSVKIETP